MNQTIYQVLATKNVVLKDLHFVELGEITTKKTLKALVGVDIKSNYWLLFFRFAKAKFLQKDFLEILRIADQIHANLGINIKKHQIFYLSPICSKTLNLMKKNGYKNDTM
ncbi:MAG: hypothetical protein ACTTJC_07955 [Campylobacter sp.]